MWYEILPCAAIITVAMALPQPFSYYFHQFTHNGNAFVKEGNSNFNMGGDGEPYKRCINHGFDELLLRRDLRLTGNPYKQKGLDAIP